MGKKLYRVKPEGFSGHVMVSAEELMNALEGERVNITVSLTGGGGGGGDSEGDIFCSETVQIGQLSKTNVYFGKERRGMKMGRRDGLSDRRNEPGGVFTWYHPCVSLSPSANMMRCDTRFCPHCGKPRLDRRNPFGDERRDAKQSDRRA